MNPPDTACTPPPPTKSALYFRFARISIQISQSCPAVLLHASPRLGRSPIHFQGRSSQFRNSRSPAPAPKHFISLALVCGNPVDFLCIPANCVLDVGQKPLTDPTGWGYLLKCPCCAGFSGPRRGGSPVRASPFGQIRPVSSFLRLAPMRLDATLTAGLNEVFT